MFQAHINKVLAEKLDVFCIVYLDNIFIYSEKADDHIENVKWVLQKLKEANLFVNVQKCKFNTDEMHFLGYTVSAAGIQIEENYIEAIQSWPKPRIIREVQVFIGFANFYRQFIKRFSQKAAPLISFIKELSKKRGKNSQDSNLTDNFFLTLEAQTTFHLIKNAFTKASILQHFDYSLPTRVEIDASERTIGGILTQQDSEGRWHLCAYYSWKMHPAEQNYKTHNGKLFAIVKAY